MNSFNNVLIILALSLTPLSNVLPAAQPNAVEQATTLQCALCTYPNPATAQACEICGEQLNHNDETKNDNGHEVKIQETEAHCTICLDEDSDEPMVVLHEAGEDTNHSFHRACIIECLSHQLNCPLCRTSIALDESTSGIGQLDLNADEITNITTSLAEQAREKDAKRAQEDREELLEDQILNAAADGDVPQLVEAIAQGANINTQDGGNDTPLHFACENGHVDIVQVLLHQPGIELSSVNTGGFTPFFSAVANNNTEIMQLFLTQDPSLINSRAQDDEGHSALHIAACYNATNALAFLITKGLNINARNHLKATPLHTAALKGHVKIVKKLVTQPGIELNPVTDDGYTPFLNAIAHNNTITMRILLARDPSLINSRVQDDDGYSALHVAAYYNAHNALTLLIARGLNINANNKYNETALHIAAYYRHIKIIKILLAQRDVEIDSVDNHGSTPFLNAVKRNHTNIMELLVLHGANVHATQSTKTQSGRIVLNNNAVHVAILNKSEEALIKLISLSAEGNGPDINAVTNDNRTPLDYAFDMDQADLEAILIDAGAFYAGSDGNQEDSPNDEGDSFFDELTNSEEEDYKGFDEGDRSDY